MRWLLFLVSLVSFGQGIPFNGNGMMHAQGGAGSITILSHNGAQGIDNGSSVTLDTTGAVLIHLSVVGIITSTPATPTDSVGACSSPCNTWTLIDAACSPSHPTFCSADWYSQPTTVGASHLIEFGSANSFTSIFAVALSGTKTVSPLDQHQGSGDTTATTCKPGNTTPSENNEIVIASALTDSTLGNPPTVDSGMTMQDSFGVLAGFAFGGGLATKIQTTAAAIDPTFTQDGVTFNACVIATYKSQ